MSVHNVESNDALEEMLQIVLQMWPLYRRLDYVGGNLRVLPKHLSLHCDACKKETFWETEIHDSSDHKNGFTSKVYRCRNCGKSTVAYYLYWGVWGKHSSFLTVGQWPELEETVSESLKNALTAEDLQMYKNALRLRNFNLGIASMAYMRRVIENRMNDMLDVLHEAARAHNTGVRGI